MTQKEIVEFLADTKVYVNGKSREIQEKLFSLGYGWNEAGTNLNKTNLPFLYINKNHYISCGYDMRVFTEHKYKEITAEEILSLEVTEPSYRPFKDKEECWQKMFKHQPFGWVTNKITEYYTIILSVRDDRDYGKALSEYTFADGAPFGIMEE